MNVGEKRNHETRSVQVHFVEPSNLSNKNNKTIIIWQVFEIPKTPYKDPFETENKIIIIFVRNRFNVEKISQVNSDERTNKFLKKLKKWKEDNSTHFVTIIVDVSGEGLNVFLKILDIAIFSVQELKRVLEVVEKQGTQERVNQPVLVIAADLKNVSHAGSKKQRHPQLFEVVRNVNVFGHFFSYHRFEKTF